ncbi:hypothetical protein D9M71_348800 [compost metagenome]
MHGLQAITRIRQCTPDDNAHRVVEVGLFQLVFDIDREDFFGQFAHEKPDSFFRVKLRLIQMGRTKLATADQCLAATYDKSTSYAMDLRNKDNP